MLILSRVITFYNTMLFFSLLFPQKACTGDQALHLLTEMESRGVPLDRMVFNAAIAAFAPSGRYVDALGLLSRMEAAQFGEKAECAWDTISFNTCMDACLKGGQGYLGVRLFQHMVETEHAEDSYISSPLGREWLKGLIAKIEDRGEASVQYSSNIIEALDPARGVYPDDVSFRLLIEAIASMGGQLSNADAAVAYGWGVTEGLFSPFNVMSAVSRDKEIPTAISMASTGSSDATAGLLWLPKKCGLVDLHG